MNGLQIKPDVQGLLIYSTMAGFSLSMLLAVLITKYSRLNTAGRRLLSSVFLLTSVLSLASVVYRGFHVHHLPMQNMFEVFLFLGACIGPIHWLSGKMLDRRHAVFLAMDAIIGLVVLFPAGFVFPHQPQFLPPALQSWLFGPHVAAYMLAYIFMAKAAVFAAAGLIQPAEASAEPVLSDYAYRMTAAGFGLLTLGLFLGSVWGKLAWGDWWGWDPKELWSLAGWLVYSLYFHIRFGWPRLYRTQYALVLLGLAVIIVTLLWVNLSRLFPGLHNYAA
jgi:ABC-type transport system involved in cytochrome c biogenesis permease subunit